MKFGFLLLPIFALLTACAMGDSSSACGPSGGVNPPPTIVVTAPSATCPNVKTDPPIKG